MGTMLSGLLNAVAAALAVVGAINWGLVGLLRFNLVSRLLGRGTAPERAVYTAVGLSGGWLGLSFVLPRILVALGVRGGRQGREASMEPIVGRVFPAMSGTLLTGEAITLPRDVEGRVTFLITGYRYESRFDAEDWTRAFQQRFGGNPDVNFFVVPMLGGIYRLFGAMIDEGMRRGSSPEEHEHTLTVYGGVEALRRELGADHSSDVWVYLLDRDGRVLFQHGGPFDEARFRELESLVDEALAGSEVPVKGLA